VKQVFNILLFLLLPALLFAQVSDTSIVKKDSAATKKDSVIARKDSIAIVKKDTLQKPVPIHPAIISYDIAMQKILKDNRFLNSAGKPVAMPNKIKNKVPDDLLFYIFVSIVMILAVLHYFYAQYFTNLFRVFSNTPLRQSQLTDQLLQAKLPSLLFNILFTIIGGLYIYLLFRDYHWLVIEKPWQVMLFCTVCLSLVYLVKFLSLKFTGWITGYTETTDTYLFVIFLINKITGILLLPIVIIMAFSDADIVSVCIIASFLFIGLMLLLRFYRSYGLLKNQLKISTVNFFVYIVGLEIVPLLLIYKSLLILLNKNL
jgi:hypothetical protein